MRQDELFQKQLLDKKKKLPKYFAHNYTIIYIKNGQRNLEYISLRLYVHYLHLYVYMIIYRAGLKTWPVQGFTRHLKVLIL